MSAAATEKPMAEYFGQCPCGHVELRLFSQLAPKEFRPRSDARTCSFCRAHDGVWISDPKGLIVLHHQNRTSVKRFASAQVQFHFCEDCKTLVYASLEDADEQKLVAVARLAIFDAIARSGLPVAELNIEDETVETARRRRLLTWTPLQR